MIAGLDLDFFAFCVQVAKSTLSRLEALLSTKILDPVTVIPKAGRNNAGF